MTQVRPGPTDPAKCDVTGAAGPFVADTVANVTVTARDRFGNRQSASDSFVLQYFTAGGETGPSSPAMAAVPGQPGKYTSAFTPRRASKNATSVTVTLGLGTVFANGTLSVEAGPVVATSSKATPVPGEGALPAPNVGTAAMTAGSVFQLDLRPRDAFGNPANGSRVALTVTAQAAFMPDRSYNASMVRGDVSQWVVAFTLEQAGLYRVTAAADGQLFYGAGVASNLQ
eukprot:6809982-Pyramimonas_sp.AAC.1